jgi:hypothetical protein
MRFRLAMGLAVVGLPLLALSAAAQTTPPNTAGLTLDDFRVSTVAQLVRLCSTPATDRGQGEALGFCHGYANGALAYHRSSLPASAPRLFCAGAPEPTAEQVRMKFVDWAGANPQRSSMRAVDGLFQFLREAYPCPQPTPSRPRR